MFQTKPHREMKLIQGTRGSVWCGGNACILAFVHQTRYVHRFIPTQNSNYIEGEPTSQIPYKFFIGCHSYEHQNI